jgi:hypothetical protein
MIRFVFSGAVAAVACSLVLATGAMAAQPHITKTQAKHEIEGDGYTGVANLHETKAG